MQGKVKFFDKKKGWGFIKADNNEEYFVHYSQIQMDGFKTLFMGDIVSFEISELDENNRIYAVSVNPVLTLDMVVHELAKEGLHLMRIGDDKGIHGWYIVDKSDKPVVDKEMNFLDLAAYAGFDTETLSA